MIFIFSGHLYLIIVLITSFFVIPEDSAGNLLICIPKLPVHCSCFSCCFLEGVDPRQCISSQKQSSGECGYRHSEKKPSKSRKPFLFFLYFFIIEGNRSMQRTGWRSRSPERKEPAPLRQEFWGAINLTGIWVSSRHEFLADTNRASWLRLSGPAWR